MARLIAIAGNIGSGKTSLVDFLSRRYPLIAGFEPHEENPYLASFFEDMPRWAFHSQLFFLAKKAQLHRQLMAAPGVALMDRSIYEDANIFARNLFLTKAINKTDYGMYRLVYEQLIEGLRPPELLIFLRCSLPAIKKRIYLRGREMEQNVPDAYLRRLNRLYADWVRDYTLSPVIEIRSDKIDYVTDLTHQIDLLKMIEAQLANAPA